MGLFSSLTSKVKQLTKNGYTTFTDVLKNDYAGIKKSETVKGVASDFSNLANTVKSAVANKISQITTPPVVNTSVTTPVKTSTPAMLNPAPINTKSMKFEVGEGLPNVTTVLPGPRISTEQAIQRGDIIKPVEAGQTPKISQAGTVKEAVKSFIEKPTVTPEKTNVIKAIVEQYTKPSESIKQAETLLGFNAPKNKAEAAISAPIRTIGKAVMRTFGPMLEPLGKDIGETIATYQLAPKIASGEFPSSVLDEIDVLKKTAPQIVGDVSQAVLAAYSPSLFGKTAINLAKKPITSALLTGGLKGAEVGLGFGAAQVASSGTTDPKEIAKIIGTSAVTMGVLGLITSGAIPVTAKVLKNITDIKTKLTNDFIKQGYTLEEATNLANHGGYVGGVPNKKVPKEGGGDYHVLVFSEDGSKTNFIKSPNAKPVPNNIGLDLFVSKNENGLWVVSEAKSGKALTNAFNTKSKAIEAVDLTFQMAKDRGIDINKTIDESVSKYGLSPKYSVPKVETPKFENIVKAVKEKKQPIAQEVPKVAEKPIAVKGEAKKFEKLAKTVKEEKAKTTMKDLYKGDRFVLNLKHFKIPKETKTYIEKEIESLKPKLEKFKGPLTHEEVVKEAQKSEIFDKAMTKDQTKQLEAKLIKTKQRLAAIDKTNGKGLTMEYLQNVKNIADEYTAIARLLESAKIKIIPEILTEVEFSATKQGIIKDLLKRGHTIDGVYNAGKNVDWNSTKEITKFYREFVKPTWGELIEEYRYANLLSSPRTHIINTFSNIIQTLGLHPATKLVHSAFDVVGSALKGSERKAYAAEVPAFYKGALNGLGDSLKEAFGALSGKKRIARPDVVKPERIPTGAKILVPFQYVTRILEASDVFFSSIVRNGEMEAGMVKALKNGKTLDSVVKREIEENANKKALSQVFRQELDPDNKTGHGHVLSFIDTLSSFVTGIRTKKYGKPIGWIVPFVRTPMDILKKGLEYSPAGIITLPGSTQKTEQLAKMFIGSMVSAGGMWMAFSGRTTWAVPTNPKEKELFYASGRQPYSLKIGDKWISYSKLGPLAYPLAMAAATEYYWKESPKDETTLKKLLNIITGTVKFFSDQSYVQGMTSAFNAVSGDEQAIKDIMVSVPSQMIPLISLQRWTAQLLDPTYRKPESGFSAKSIWQNLQKNIPFASMNLKPYLTPQGTPSTRQRKNLFLPFDIGNVNQTNEDYLKHYNEIRKINSIAAAKTDKITQDAQKLADEWLLLPKEEAKIKWEELNKTDPILASKVATIVKKIKLGLTPDDESVLSLRVDNGDRALEIKRELDNLTTKEEKAKLWNDYVKKGIITDDVGTQLNSLFKKQK